MVDRILSYPDRTRIQVLSPVVSGKKGAHVKVLEDIKKQGYVRVRVDGDMYDLEEEIELIKIKNIPLKLLIDRIVVKEGVATRLADSLESA